MPSKKCSVKDHGCYVIYDYCGIAKKFKVIINTYSFVYRFVFYSKILSDGYCKKKTLNTPRLK